LLQGTLRRRRHAQIDPFGLCVNGFGRRVVSPVNL